MPTRQLVLQVKSIGLYAIRPKKTTPHTYCFANHKQEIKFPASVVLYTKIKKIQWIRTFLKYIL